VSVEKRLKAIKVEKQAELVALEAKSEATDQKIEELKTLLRDREFQLKELNIQKRMLKDDNY
jgi:hypothetical protein